MTIRQFKTTPWCAGIKVKCRSMRRSFQPYISQVVSVNFDQCLIATADSPDDQDNPDTWSWWRCENCELIPQ